MRLTAIRLFAAGLLHYQQNRDCARTAKYTISYNSDDPQTVNQAIVSSCQMTACLGVVITNHRLTMAHAQRSTLL